MKMIFTIFIFLSGRFLFLTARSRYSVYGGNVSIDTESLFKAQEIAYEISSKYGNSFIYDNLMKKIIDEYFGWKSLKFMESSLYN